MRRLLTRLAWGLAFLAVLPACSRMLFYPEPQLLGTPDQLGMEYRDAIFTSSDGVVLNGWFLPARKNTGGNSGQPGGRPARETARGTARGTVLFLHGNAQNLSYHFGAVSWLPDQGYNVFLFDYRGFGRSGGKRGLAGAIRDASAALAHLRARPDVDPERLIVFGQSIGAAIAVDMVTRNERDGIRALILESPPASYRRIAREKLGGFFLTWPLQWPLSWLIPDRDSPERLIARVAPMPLLVVHGDADRVVPMRHGETLFAAAGPPKWFWRIPGGNHIEAFLPTRPAWREQLLTFMDDALAGRLETTPENMPENMPDAGAAPPAVYNGPHDDSPRPAPPIPAPVTARY
ncbi:MAG: lysophospholipase [Nitrospirota bacterium]|nr:lysophospholipase [Nitrospirota bacterium]